MVNLAETSPQLISLASLRARLTLPVFVTAVVLLTFLAVDEFKEVYADVFVRRRGLFVFLTVLFACASLKVTYSDTHKSFRTALRGLALLMGAYAALAYPNFNAESHVHFEHLTRVHDWIRLLVVASALAAWIRPAFALVAGVGMMVGKDLSRHVQSLNPAAGTDYLPAIEFAFILALGLVIGTALLALWRRLEPRIGDREMVPALTVALFLIAVGVHFGNYLYSGIAKVMLDGGPLDWLLNNHTELLMEVAERGGYLPISAFSGLATMIHEGMAAAHPWPNLFVLALQLGAIVAVTRVRWLLWTTVIYDLMHVSIFLFTGIFFWKWIVLNGLIIAGLVSLRGFKFPRYLQIICVLCVAFGHHVFFTARLGWYDTPAFTNRYFEAILDNGETRRVPSNYFLGGSMTVAQERFGAPDEYHFPVGTWGSTIRSSIHRTAHQGCEFDPDEKQIYPFSERLLDHFVGGHHRHAVSAGERTWIPPAYLYPHHIFSNPMEYRAFYATDPATIQAYRYVVESICLDGKLGTDDDRVMWRSEHLVALDENR